MHSFILPHVSDLATVMQHLEQHDSRIVFLEKDGLLIGCLTDGDVRRGSLRGMNLSDPAVMAANLDCVTAKEGDTPAQIHRLFREGVSAIPLIDDSGSIVDVLTRSRNDVIPIAQPNIGMREIQLVNECLESGWISSIGRFVPEFEQRFASYIGAEHCVATSSGTTALVTALTALGIGPGDEVIVPDLTFGASANAVLQVGATPSLVDVDRDSWCIETKAIQQAITSVTKAVMPVHLYGRAANMHEVANLARVHDLLVIEDCAEALDRIRAWKCRQN